MRKKIVAGNWKMNTNLTDGIRLAVSVKELYHKKSGIKAEARAVSSLYSPFQL